MARPLQRPRPERGEHLAQLRRAANLSQTALAELIGEPQSTLAKWELSERPPPSDVVPGLAKALGVSVEDVLHIRAVRAPKKRGPLGKVGKVFDEVSKLPPRQQDQIVQVVAALVSQFKSRAA